MFSRLIESTMSEAQKIWYPKPATAEQVKEVRDIAKKIGKFGVKKGSGSVKFSVIIHDKEINGTGDPKVRIALAKALIKAGYDSVSIMTMGDKYSLKNHAIKLAKDYDHHLVNFQVFKVDSAMPTS